VDAVQFFFLIQRRDKFAQVFIRFCEIHKFFVYAFFRALASNARAAACKQVSDP
jgi:hypothetical protein